MLPASKSRTTATQSKEKLIPLFDSKISAGLLESQAICVQGSGFVQFALPEDAARAVKAYNGKILLGRPVQVSSASYRWTPRVLLS